MQYKLLELKCDDILRYFVYTMGTLPYFHFTKSTEFSRKIP